jgi:hypothetical protein
MSTGNQRNIFVRIFSAFWRFIDETRRAIINVFVLFILIMKLI